ncbi:MAG: hypothetical protein HY557_03850 [Euryarchaeota archaeon]|nr:hypothetical protein [Euryarchaeota archaeon]
MVGKPREGLPAALRQEHVIPGEATRLHGRPLRWVAFSRVKMFRRNLLTMNLAEM